MMYLIFMSLILLTISAKKVDFIPSTTTESNTARTTSTSTVKPITSDAGFNENVVKQSSHANSAATVIPSKLEVPPVATRNKLDNRAANRTNFKWIEHKQAKLARERDMWHKDFAKRKRISKISGEVAENKTKFMEPKKSKAQRISHLGKAARNSNRDSDNVKPSVKKPCPECERRRIKEQLETNRKLSLRKQIMDKLKIDPTRTFKRPVIPQEILRRSMIKDESDTDDDADAKTTDILVFGRDITNRCRFRKSTGCYKFDVRRKITGRITSAELYVYKLHDPNDGQQSIFLQELERPKHRKLMPRNIISRVDTDITEGWLSFRLDKTVLKWAQEPLENDGIAVKCKTCAGTRHKQLYSAKEGYRPFLVVHMQPFKHRRRQRRSADCGAVIHTCCKHDFWVDFEEIDLPHVLRPKGLWANYCTGPCGPLVNGHYNHTTLLQAVRWTSETANNTIRNAITPCCGAVRLKTISLLYITNDGDINRADVPNLQLAECGCL